MCLNERRCAQALCSQGAVYSSPCTQTSQVTDILLSVVTVPDARQVTAASLLTWKTSKKGSQKQGQRGAEQALRVLTVTRIHRASPCPRMSSQLIRAHPTLAYFIHLPSSPKWGHIPLDYEEQKNKKIEGNVVVVTEHAHETVTSSTRKPGDQVPALKIMLLAARPQCHTETRGSYAKLRNDCGRWPSLASIATAAKLPTTAWVPTW